MMADMGVRPWRAVVSVLLGASGGLMYAASWQRWAGACGWGDIDGELCTLRQDHLYDFLPVGAPWEPIGSAAQLAGASLLVLAVAFTAMPWALTGRRPGSFSAVMLASAVTAMAAVGGATLASGLSRSVVAPPASGLVLYVWLFVAPGLLAWCAVTVAVRGWAVAAIGCLVLGSPIVAVFSYAIGPYDARPWWEGVSGGLTAIGGLCLLVDAVLDGRRSDAVPAIAAPSTDAA